jgi:hypothetical protein
MHLFNLQNQIENNKIKEYKKSNKENLPYANENDRNIQNKIRSIIGYEDNILNKNHENKKIIYHNQANKFTNKNNKNNYTEKNNNKKISNVFENSINNNEFDKYPYFNKIKRGLNKKFIIDINKNNNNNDNIKENIIPKNEIIDKEKYFKYETNKNHNDNININTKALKNSGESLISNTNNNYNNNNNNYNKNNLNFILCINCDNIISVNDIGK